MGCLNQVGVKNLLLGFADCDNGSSGGIGNVAGVTHSMAQDELPMYDSVPYTLEALSGGRVKRTYKNCSIKVNVVRNKAIPLQYYQGRASVDYQCEHIDGSVFTGAAGSVVEADDSDSNEVSMTISFASIVEVLAPGATLR